MEVKERGQESKEEKKELRKSPSFPNKEGVQKEMFRGENKLYY